MPFERAKAGSTKKDMRGTVFLKIILQIEGGQPGFPVPGNRKEQIEIKDTTVGEVYGAIEKALFGGERTGDVKQEQNVSE